MPAGLTARPRRRRNGPAASDLLAGADTLTPTLTLTLTPNPNPDPDQVMVHSLEVAQRLAPVLGLGLGLVSLTLTLSLTLTRSRSGWPRCPTLRTLRTRSGCCDAVRMKHAPPG